MTNSVQFAILEQGVSAWNEWRAAHPDVLIDLSGADLYGVDLSRINLNHANLQKAFLERANLTDADLMHADLSRANLIEARLITANLRRANLARANLFGSDLLGADLTDADLTAATLANASLASARIEGARVSGCWVYGVNVRDLQGEFSEQTDLIITHRGQPTITVDNIKVAQFVYLFLNNQEIREAIDTLTSKTVLLLGHFGTPDRKAILETLKDGLRKYDLLPVVFEYERPSEKDFTDTIRTLASLSYFVIADMTNPKAAPLDLPTTLPDYQVPFVPIIQVGERPFAMMNGLHKKYPWVLEPVPYTSAAMLRQELKTAIIDPALKKRNKLRFNEIIEQRIKTTRELRGKGEE
ncbi:MAG: pentapeptide repeat-containing protein [Anaerolineales bacterium]|nr:pentapeptide repeat-containing protein [Anaerolineales bacterium]